MHFLPFYRVKVPEVSVWYSVEQRWQQFHVKMHFSVVTWHLNSNKHELYWLKLRNTPPLWADMTHLL